MVLITSVSAKSWPKPPELEKWQLSDGSVYQARLLYFNDKEAKDGKLSLVATMADEAGLIQEHSLDHFSTTTAATLKQRRLTMPVRSYEKKMGYMFPPPPATGWQYVAMGDNSRKSIPSYNQTDYGYKAGSCLPNSLVNTMSWWDQQKMIVFPQKRTAHKQVDWLHTIISRESRTRNSGTYWDDLIVGVKDFTENSLKGDYQMPCYVIENVTPEKLALFTRENWAVCLHVELYYKNRNSGGHGVTLVSADASGAVVLKTWGLKIEGKMTPIKSKKKPRRKGVAQIDYEIIITNRHLQPDWFQNQEVRFKIEADRNPNCYVFLPMEKQMAGRKWNPGPKPIEVGPALGIKKTEAKKTPPTRLPVQPVRNKREYDVRIKLHDLANIEALKVGHEVHYDENKKRTVNLLAVSNDNVVRRYREQDIFESHMSLFRYYCKGANSSAGHMKKFYAEINKEKPYQPRYFSVIHQGLWFPPKPVMGWMHMDAGKIDRSQIPNISPESYGVKSGPSVQNAIVNTLIWWQRNKVINFPDVGSEKKLCQILHKALTPKHATLRSSAHWGHVAQTLQSLGLNSLKGDVAFVIYKVSIGHSKDTFAEYMKILLDKHYGVFMAVDLYSNDGELYGRHAVQVTGVDDDGVLTFLTMGQKLTGRLKEGRGVYRNRREFENRSTELEVINSGALPKWYRDKKLQMRSDGVNVIIPYVPVKEGMKWVDTPPNRMKR